jgi:hypothetical protein
MSQDTQQQLTTTTPADLISQAIEKGLDVETLGKLMDLQDRWQATQARKLFFESFTSFQSECPDIRKTKAVAFEGKTAGSVSYHYAPLADITRQIGPILKKHELSYRWEIQDTDKEIKVTCLVSHVSGHTERTTMQANPDTSGAKNPIQARGSAIEYLKRYTLIGALGISTADTDIDGRLPELDIDKLHKQYMDLFNQIIIKDPTLRTTMDPDNWKLERTADLYIKAIGKARQTLAKLTVK